MKSNKELCSTIKRIIRNKLFDDSFKNEMIKNLKSNYNLPEFIYLDIYSERKDVSEYDSIILFCLSNELSKLGYLKIEDYYTKTDIDNNSKFKYVENKIEFPLKLKMISVNKNQWIGKISVDELITMRNSGMINYNPETQRTMMKIKRNGNDYYKIMLNNKSVGQISELMLNEEFIPNTITLNIPYDEFGNFYYDENDSMLIINKLEHFDILDGYHRYRAICNSYDKNNDFKYDMELRVVFFGIEKAKKFIFQEDQKNKMRKIDVNSYDTNKPSNIICDRLNEDNNCMLKNAIKNNGGKINYSVMSEIIDYFYFKNVDKNSGMAYINNVYKNLKNQFNSLFNEHDSLLDMNLEFIDLSIIIYMFKKNDLCDNNIIIKLLEHKDQLDKRKFSSNTMKKSVIKEIERLEALLC